MRCDICGSFMTRWNEMYKTHGKMKGRLVCSRECVMDLLRLDANCTKDEVKE